MTLSWDDDGTLRDYDSEAIHLTFAGRCPGAVWAQWIPTPREDLTGPLPDLPRTVRPFGW